MYLTTASLRSVQHRSPLRMELAATFMILVGRRSSSTTGTGSLIQATHCKQFGNTRLSMSSTHPAQADITAHVDFSAIARTVDGIAARSRTGRSGAWLKRLGIVHRRDALTKSADDTQSRDIRSAYHRLTDENEMGSLFKVMALTQHGCPAPAGFEDDH